MSKEKEALMRLAEPMDEQTQNAMARRKSQRRLIAMSTAIAAKIECALRLKGMKRTELAQQLGVSPANVTRYLSGKCNFELKTLLALEDVLDISLINRDAFPLKNRDVKPYPVLHTTETALVVGEYQEAYYSSSDK